MAHVIAAATLTAGLRNTFHDAYKQTTEGRLERLGKVMELGLPSDKLTEPYAYFLTAPYPKRWDRGKNISARPFSSVDFSVTNLDWGRRIPWHENDREDDQLKDLFSQAKTLGMHFATLHERIFFQMILAQANPDLLKAIPNCPDGVAIFSATDGVGGARYGAAGGNIITGTGVLTAQTIQTDVLNGLERFRQFQDPEGEPLWDDAMLDSGGYTLVYGVHNDGLVRTALKASLMAQTFLQVNAGSDTHIAGAAPTNILEQEFAAKFTLWPTQRITTDDLYLFANGAPHKCVFQQERRGMRESFANVDNSDLSRATKEEYLQFDARYGYGSFLAYQAIQIDN